MLVGAFFWHPHSGMSVYESDFSRSLEKKNMKHLSFFMMNYAIAFINQRKETTKYEVGDFFRGWLRDAPLIPIVMLVSYHPAVKHVPLQV